MGSPVSLLTIRNRVDRIVGGVLGIESIPPHNEIENLIFDVFMGIWLIICLSIYIFIHPSVLRISPSVFYKFPLFLGVPFLENNRNSSLCKH